MSDEPIQVEPATADPTTTTMPTAEAELENEIVDLKAALTSALDRLDLVNVKFQQAVAALQAPGSIYEKNEGARSALQS